MMRSDTQIKEYLNFLIVERGLSPNTIESYGRDIRSFVSSQRITDLSVVSAQDLSDHVAHARSREIAESSIARSVVAIRNAVAFTCKEEGKTNQIIEVKPPRIPSRLPKALSISEVTSLIESTKLSDDPHSIRGTAIAELLYGTGARISEIVTLNMSDISKIDRSEIASIRLTGKGGKTRIVPIGKYARDALDQYLVRVRPSLVKESKKDRDALFLNDRGTRLSRQSMWKVISDAAARANLPTHVSPHSLRHSYATHLLDGGADIRVVQELLGHASVTTTQIYTLVTIDKLRESYANAHPRANE